MWKPACFKWWGGRSFWKSNSRNWINAEERVFLVSGNSPGGPLVQLECVAHFITTVEVKGHNAVLLAEGPPPPEPSESRKLELRITGTSQFFYKCQNWCQGLSGPAVVRLYGDFTTELQDCTLLISCETCFLQDHHTFRFAKNIIIESALRNAITRWCLGESHLLCYYRMYSFLQLSLRPGGHFQFQECGTI